MPRLCLVTHAIENIREIVNEAIKCGIRYFDITWTNKNQKYFGIVIKKAIDECLTKEKISL